MALVMGMKTTLRVFALSLCMGSVAYAGNLLNSNQKRPPEKAGSTQAQTDVSPADDEASSESVEFSRSTTVFDNWSVHCRSNAAEKSCYAETIMRSKDNPPREILTLRFRKLEEGYGVTGTVPVGVSLDAPMLVTLAEKENRPLQYRRCSTKSCTATVQFEEPILSNLASKDAFLVTFFTFSRDAENGRRPNTLSVSTRGLSAALKALAE